MSEPQPRKASAAAQRWPGSPGCLDLAGALVAVGLGSLAVITAFQLGLINRLPSPRGRRWQAERLHRSRLAYPLGGVPDGLLGLASYLATGGLILAAKHRNPREHRAVPLALGAKAVVDAALALDLTRRGWRCFRRFSVYSLAVGAVSLGVLPCVLPVVASAWRGGRTPSGGHFAPGWKRTGRVTSGACRPH